MVLYENTKQGFLRDVRTGHLSEILKSLFISNHIGHAEAETTSWKNSSAFVSNILKDPGFDDDITVYLEYQVFLTSKRVDLMLAGTDAQGRNNLMILYYFQNKASTKQFGYDIIPWVMKNEAKTQTYRRTNDRNQGSKSKKPRQTN